MRQYDLRLAVKRKDLSHQIGFALIVLRQVGECLLVEERDV